MGAISDYFFLRGQIFRHINVCGRQWNRRNRLYSPEAMTKAKKGFPRAIECMPF